MHEVNILPPFSLARFFLTQQLTYKSKIEKHNVSIDNFVSDISIARNLDVPRIGEKAFGYTRIHTLF